MTAGWHRSGDDAPLTGRQAAELIRQRLEHGHRETWLEHDRGGLLAVVTNQIRALVMLLDEPGDPGGQAVDPTATGRQDGYILDNGQDDTYDNRDTIPLDRALHTVEHIVDHGRPPADVDWQINR